VRTLTIGEVLNQLKDEFEDITISKIRFLESEGLVSPERTESGYRKFTDADVERLRYVLRSQRDRYLPLKVIRDELERIDAGQPVAPALPAPPHETPRGPEAGTPGGTPPLVLEQSERREVSFAELCDAASLEPSDIHALQEHGILRAVERFDGEDVEIAAAAAALLELGLEPRHLRMYRQFAERETALCEQLVAPLLRQRNPDSRGAAAERVEDLVGGGARLHRLLLGRRVRSLLGS
jgi:DNA-binding transcriptional MerR regulator